MSRENCTNVVWLGLGTKTTWLRLGKDNVAHNIWLGLTNCNKHGWKMSPFLVENIQWFHTYTCWNAISHSGLAAVPSVCENVLWMCHEMYCRNVYMFLWLC